MKTINSLLYCSIAIRWRETWQLPLEPAVECPGNQTEKRDRENISKSSRDISECAMAELAVNGDTSNKQIPIRGRIWCLLTVGHVVVRSFSRSSTWDISFQEQYVSMTRINIPCLVSVTLRWNDLSINFLPLRMICHLHPRMRQQNHWTPWPGLKMKPINVAHRRLNIQVVFNNNNNNSRTSLKVSNTKDCEGNVSVDFSFDSDEPFFRRAWLSWGKKNFPLTHHGLIWSYSIRLSLQIKSPVQDRAKHSLH